MVFVHFAIECKQKRRVRHLVGAHAEFGIQHFRAFCERCFHRIELLGPVTIKIVEMGRGRLECEACRCKVVERNRRFLLVFQLHPLLDDILLVISFVTKPDLQRVVGIFEKNRRLRHIPIDFRDAATLVHEAGGEISVRVRNAQRGIRNMGAVSRKCSRSLLHRNFGQRIVHSFTEIHLL